MPELDYMVLADYVREDTGTIHIMGAGIDTFTVPQVPAAAPVGIALRITFGRTEEVGGRHLLKLIFQGPDQHLLDIDASFLTPPQPAGVPEHWRTAVGMALRLMLPLPAYGDYSLELVIDDK